MSEKTEDSLIKENMNGPGDEKTTANGKPEKKSRTKKEVKPEENPLDKELTPSQIVAELDKYIIGQNNAKKSVAIAH